MVLVAIAVSFNRIPGYIVMDTQPIPLYINLTIYVPIVEDANI